MLTETYDSRPRQDLVGTTIGRVRRNERGTIYRTGTDERGRPVDVTLSTIEFRVIE